MRKLSLIIDDVSPINLMAYHEPSEKHRRDISDEFLKLFSHLVNSNGIRGKMSLIPFPGGEDIITPEFAEYVRSFNGGKWDFSSEGFTHWKVQGTDVREDDYFDTASSASMYEYLLRTFQWIEYKFGVKPDSVTSPWGAGSKNRKAYEEAIHLSLSRYLPEMKKFWYFLDVNKHNTFKKSKITKVRIEENSVLFHVPAMVEDYWWNHNYSTKFCGTSKAMDRMRILLSSLSEEELPLITILTHWQSLYSNGSWRGLSDFVDFCHQVKSEFGLSEWTTVSEHLKTL